MKSLVPLSGLVAYSAILLLGKLQLIPDPAASLQGLSGLYAEWSFLLLFLVILVESIAYVGFYFPGQLFAVLLVLLNDFSWFNLIMLTLVSIVAVTISAGINYQLGSLRTLEKKEFRLKGLLLAMLHINLLALYMFQLGASRSHRKVILYAGLLNIPYYLLLIAGTFLIRDQITIITEDTYFLLFLLCTWTSFTVVLDLRERRKKRTSQRM
jgi:membrane-associated protein